MRNQASIFGSFLGHGGPPPENDPVEDAVEREEPKENLQVCPPLSFPQASPRQHIFSGRQTPSSHLLAGPLEAPVGLTAVLVGQQRVQPVLVWR